jgi:hypothetical protein
MEEQEETTQVETPTNDVNMWGNNTPQVEAPQPIEEAGIPIVETTEEAGIEIPVEQAKVEPATQERVVEKIVDRRLQ